MGELAMSREEIQEAICKTVELRALHAALMQGNTNTPPHPNLKFLSSSPSPSLSLFTAHDYPVFTPSYEDEPLSEGYGHLQMSSQSIPESWDDNRIGENEDSLHRSSASSRKGTLPPRLLNLDHTHICPLDHRDNASVTSSNHLPFLQNSPGTETLRSRRRNISLGGFYSVSSCNKCNPATISNSKSHYSNIIVPLTDSHASMAPSTNSSAKSRFSWLFPKLKRRQKHEKISTPARTECEEVSQVLTDLGIVSTESLRNELLDANHKRDLALREVSDMRLSFGDLKKKLEHLELYCEELKKSLRQASLGSNLKISKRGKINGDNLMPVDEQVMIEGFLQIVSEARSSVKQFCKILTAQIQETDQQLNLVLKPYKSSKAVFYHMEAIINQALYQDFENSAFQKNGSPKFLDPQKERQAQFQSFAALRNLSWNEVIKKGTKYYSEEFSKFCDQKMSCVIKTLNWTRPWLEELLQSFFVAAKCIWLLHLLAFSFFPPLGILRVEENRAFDPHYMDDMISEKGKVQGLSRVKIMVMPGFFVQDQVLRCKVMCRYKSAA